jgi:uncharacterized membrane protein
VPATIGGLPLHPLVVHAAVVFVPLAALAVLAYAFVPRYRAWSRLLTPVLAVFAALTVPVATSTGEGLEHMVQGSAQVHEHAELGDTMIPIAFLLAAAAISLYWLNRPQPEGAKPRAPRGALLTVTALAAVVSLGSIVQVVRVGHSGAESAWSDVQPENGGGEAAGVTK